MNTRQQLTKHETGIGARLQSLVWALPILLVAGLVRMWNLKILPPFIDESGHIYFATHYATYSLTQRMELGKVLGYLLFYPTAAFAADPLYATRLLVAALGVVTTLGIFMLLRRISSLTSAIAGSLIWALMPYVVFHDRMALHDPIATAFVVWSIVATLDAVQRKSPMRAGIGGILLGLAILTKAQAALIMLWLPLIAIALRDHPKLRSYLRTGLAFIACLVVTALPEAVIMLRSGMAASGQILNLNASPDGHASFWSNVRTLSQWFSDYNSWPCSVLFIAILISTLVRRSRISCALGLSCILSVGSYAILFSAMVPRYFLPSLVPIVLLTALVVSDWGAAAVAALGQRVRSRQELAFVGCAFAFGILLAASAYAWVKSDSVISRNPIAARMPLVDRVQYLDGWASGYGLEEVAHFLNERAQNSGPTLVFVGGFGSHGWVSLPIAAKLNPNIAFHSGFVTTRQDIAGIVAVASRQPTYMFFESPGYDAPSDLLALALPPPKLVFEYRRPRGPGRFQLYLVNPSSHMSLDAEQQKTLASGVPIITDIINPNGLESYNGVPFMWLGVSETTVLVESPEIGDVDLEGVFSPGPSIADHGERHLKIAAPADFSEIAAVVQGRYAFRIPLRKGMNQIRLLCFDPVSVPTQPSGDTRTLLVRVTNLRLSAFRPLP